ncbi:MAG: hypothetical protein FJW40_06935 [Acidobacteria bacterium]|nr:hypothetical protein [Acidobacteriota bacterium]
MTTLTSRFARLAGLAALALAVSGVPAWADHSAHHTNGFKGPKANTGSAMHYIESGKQMLAVSEDFQIPDTPAPSWQVVDSKGNVYLLNQFKIKGGTNRRIALPAYIKDVAKVQVWCSFAEVLLGEASFKSAVK